MKSVFKSILVVFLMLTIVSVKQSFAQTTPTTPTPPSTVINSQEEPSQEETLRAELETDGYLLKNGRKTKYSFLMEDGEIFINGKEVTGKALKKYSDLMEELYGDVNSARIRLSKRGENSTSIIVSIQN